MAKSRALYHVFHHLNHAWVLPCCRDTEEEFDVFVGPPGYSFGEVAVDALVDACQIIDIPLLRICESGCVRRIVSILWIQEKLEVLLDAKVWVMRIGRKSPREKVAVSFVVCEYCIDLVCETVSGCSWPVLDSLRPCPFWCRRV